MTALLIRLRSVSRPLCVAMFLAACSSAPTASLASLPGHYVVYSVDGSTLPVPYYPASTNLPQNVVIAAGTADITPANAGDSLALALTVNTLDSLGQVTASGTDLSRLAFTTRQPDTLVFDYPSDSAILRGTAIHLTLHIPVAPSLGFSYIRHVLVLLPQ
jgi:hypothetical protein